MPPLILHSPHFPTRTAALRGLTIRRDRLRAAYRYNCLARNTQAVGACLRALRQTVCEILRVGAG